MEVKVYTTPTCPWCQKVKEWLKKNKVSFQELDVTESDTYRDEVLEKTGKMALPVIEIDDIVISGFDEPKLKKALNL
jgi:glutaredoxin 3